MGQLTSWEDTVGMGHLCHNGWVIYDLMGGAFMA